jgi:GNAT superfamily N-acetyltransferase
MQVTIRPARVEDHRSIAAYTQETFTWGDYVPEAFPGWLEDPTRCVVVAADPDDRPVGVSSARMVSPYEAWFQGARVHPDWRRRGLAGRMAEALVDEVRRRGASVGRLIIEDWNEAAQGQVQRDGFRPVATWLMAERTVGAASPVPSGNGGRRVPALEQLARAHSAEAEPAFMSWTAGPLGRAARGMFAVDWTWRRLTVDDLHSAARHDALWAARPGWALAARDDDSLEVGWVECRPEDALDLMRALVDLAVNEGTERIALMLPEVPWLSAAARRSGCELHPMTLFERAL